MCHPPGVFRGPSPNTACVEEWCGIKVDIAPLPVMSGPHLHDVTSTSSHCSRSPPLHPPVSPTYLCFLCHIIAQSNATSPRRTDSRQWCHADIIAKKRQICQNFHKTRVLIILSHFHYSCWRTSFAIFRLFASIIWNSTNCTISVSKFAAIIHHCTSPVALDAILTKYFPNFACFPLFLPFSPFYMLKNPRIPKFKSLICLNTSQIQSLLSPIRRKPCQPPSIRSFTVENYF